VDPPPFTYSCPELSPSAVINQGIARRHPKHPTPRPWDFPLHCGVSDYCRVASRAFAYGVCLISSTCVPTLAPTLMTMPTWLPAIALLLPVSAKFPLPTAMCCHVHNTRCVSILTLQTPSLQMSPQHHTRHHSPVAVTALCLHLPDMCLAP